MIIEILQIDQGKTTSETSEGFTPEQCQTQQARLRKAGGRFVIFPTRCQMMAWRGSLVEIEQELPPPR